MTSPHPTKLWRLVALMALTVLLAAACSSDAAITVTEDASEQSTTEPEPGVTVVDASTPTPAPSPTATLEPTAEPTATAEPEPTATAEPTATPEPELAPTPDPDFEPAATFDLNGGAWALEPRNISYRSRISARSEAVLTDGTEERVQVVAWGTKIVETGEQYFVAEPFPEIGVLDCVDQARDADFVNAYFVLFEKADSEFIGQATLAESGVTTNGILADRYAMTEDNLGDPVDFKDGGTLGDFFIDIAREGGMLVQMVVQITGGQDDVLPLDAPPESTTTTIEADFYDFDDVDEYIAPDACNTQ